MAQSSFSSTGVSVTATWTTLATIAEDENHPVVSLSFEISTDSGNANQIADVKVQAKDHTSGAWYDLVVGDALTQQAVQWSDRDDPPPTIRANNQVNYRVAIPLVYDLRIQARTDDGAATVDIYGFAETLNPVAGDVYGPISGTDNALVRMDGTSGKLVQNSGVTLDDSEQMEFGGGRVRNAGVAEVLGTTPPTPATGMLWYDTSGDAGVGGVVAITTKTGAYTAADTDTVIICDATGGAFTVALPAAGDNTGKVFYLKKIDSSANAVTIDGDGAETIDDAATLVLNSQYDAAMLVSDGTEWWIL